jgi:hypothetical protein
MPAAASQAFMERMAEQDSGGTVLIFTTATWQEFTSGIQ